MATLPKGSLVLVSGASGFIASHVVDQLLNYGYKVRGTVRSDQKGRSLAGLFDERYGKGAFTYVLVPDLTAETAFDEAVKGVQGVCHVASPVTFEEDLKTIDVAVGGTRNMLRSAAREPGITRFVLTSSSTAATLPKPNTRFHIDANSWNDDGVRYAQTPPLAGKGFEIYGAGKTLAEQAAWRFMREQAPPFALTTVLPNMTLGTILLSDQAGSTAAMVRGLWEGEPDMVKFLRDGFAPQYYVHVRDIALLHVAGVALGDTAGERLFGFAGPFNFNSFVDAMRAIDPQRALPAKLDKPGEDLSTVDTASAVAALQKLNGKGFASFEEGVRDCIAPSRPAA